MEKQTINVLLISSHRLPGLKSSRGSLPVSLLNLASALRKSGHRPVILDLSIVKIPDSSNPEEYCLSKIDEAIKKNNPGLIGLSCFTTMHFPLVSKLARAIRAKEPGVPICMGGVHPTLFSEKILENCPEVDFIAVGEGEEQIVILADAIASGHLEKIKDVQGLGYRCDDRQKFVVNPRQTFTTALDDLPGPAYDMVNFSHYYDDHSNWHNPKQKEIRLSVPIYTTRSCPFNCSFCSVPLVMGRALRRRTPEKVADEIEILVRDYGQNYFSLSDDNVNVDKKHFMAVCHAIVQRKLDLQLCIAQGLYLSMVDEDIVRAFVEAGGITVSVPIESGNNFLRTKIIGKHLTDEKIYEIVRLLQKYDLFTIGFFIMGFPEDTVDTLNDMLVMIAKLKLDVSSVNTLIPFPGTRIYQQAVKERLFLFDEAKVWNGEIFFDPLNKRDFFIQPYNLSLEELRRFRERFNEVYFTSKRAQILNVRP